MRVALGINAAALTFPAYREIAQADGEAWVAYRPRFRMDSSIPCASLRGCFARRPRWMPWCGMLWDVWILLSPAFRCRDASRPFHSTSRGLREEASLEAIGRSARLPPPLEGCLRRFPKHRGDVRGTKERRAEFILAQAVSDRNDLRARLPACPLRSRQIPG